MYKSHSGPKQDESYANRETVEQFLARGGKIEKVGKQTSGTKKARKVQTTSNKIDAQKLLDSVSGTAKEVEVINFLKSQGIEVE